MYHISISCRQVLCNNGKTVHKTTAGVHMSSSYSSKFAFVLPTCKWFFLFNFFNYLHIRTHSHTCLIFCPFINLQFFYADIKTCIATLILLLNIPAGVVGSYMYAGALLSCTQGEKRELNIPPSTLL
jgi:hypothetical protein